MPAEKIRTLGPADAAACAEVHAASFAKSWREDEFLRFFAQPAVSGDGLFRAGRLASFVLFSHVPPEAEILTLCTRPGVRGQGLAQRLLQAAFARLARSDCEKVLLDVAEGNQAALKLYQACGFVMLSRRKGYYGDQDALVMMRRLVATRLQGSEKPAR